MLQLSVATLRTGRQPPLKVLWGTSVNASNSFIHPLIETNMGILRTKKKDE